MKTTHTAFVAILIWVYSRREQIRTPVGRAGFVALLMIGIPLAFHLPAHLLLKRLFHSPAR